MGETLTEDGNVENFKVENNRVSFKLNGKIYACFEKTQDGNDNDVAKAAKEIIITDSTARVAIEYYDNVKDNKTYHNLTAITIVDPTAPAPIKEEPIGETQQDTFINGAEYGLCCHLAQRMVSSLGEPFQWDAYEENVKRFFETNKKIKEELK